MLRATFGTVHWPLLVAASLALLAVRPFPTYLLSYAARAESLVRRFLELSGRLPSGGRSAALPVRSELAALHEAFKSLEEAASPCFELLHFVIQHFGFNVGNRSVYKEPRDIAAGDVEGIDIRIELQCRSLHLRQRLCP